VRSVAGGIFSAWGLRSTSPLVSHLARSTPRSAPSEGARATRHFVGHFRACYFASPQCTAFA
jgi:hypothetical protein